MKEREINVKKIGGNDQGNGGAGLNDFDFPRRRGAQGGGGACGGTSPGPMVWVSQLSPRGEPGNRASAVGSACLGGGSVRPRIVKRHLRSRAGNCTARTVARSGYGLGNIE